MTLEETLRRIEASPLENKKVFIEMVENIFQKGKSSKKLYNYYEEIQLMPQGVLDTTNLQKNVVLTVPEITTPADYNNVEAKLQDLLLTDKYLLWKGVFLFEIKTPRGPLPFFASILSITRLTKNIPDSQYKNLKVILYSSVNSFLRAVEAQKRRKQQLTPMINNLSDLI